MSEHGPIIQTNIDHWSSEANEDILYSIQRRTLSKQLLDQMKTINEHELWEVKRFDFYILNKCLCPIQRLTFLYLKKNLLKSF